MEIITGILSSLLGNKLTSVAKAVVDKGVDYVEDKLGIKLEPDMSPEKIAEIKIQMQKHEEFRIQEENKNTASAREMNTAVQSTADASFLAKNAAYILDFGIVIAAVALSAICFFIGIPIANEQIVYTTLGSLWTLAASVVNFHRGSSSGSQAKQVTLDNVLKGKK